ncbi:uncharacterized protein DUF1049 [Sinobacterium caligoides]|uniref:Uncharacterized protein DUF1049 n=1 Tax=Sinobacterium caligoides TaxID=933926 RepID=A0A3N2E0A1_9GAMM|nr:LapA family protein [Sinobacterium caligoides]ROS05129.1 uncharacterized protein DUF1049 [Sinobacterium caligoides]
MRIVKLLLMALLIIAVIVMALLFLVENNTSVTVDLFLFDMTVTSGSWVVLSFITGAVAGLGSAAAVFIKMYGRQAQLKRKLVKSEKALARLKQNPMSS